VQVTAILNVANTTDVDADTDMDADKIEPAVEDSDVGFIWISLRKQTARKS